MLKTRYKERLNAFLPAALITFAILFLSYDRVFDGHELETLDLRYKIRSLHRHIDKKIIIIEISDDSIKKIGSWPFDRKWHSLLIKALCHGGAKQITFDIFFSEPKPGDPEFIKAVNEAGNVYMPYVFDLYPERKGDIMPVAKDFEIKPLEDLARASKGTGHINIVPDIDGKFRRIPPFIKMKDKLYPHISVLAAANYLNISKDRIKIIPQKYLMIGDIKIPLDLYSNIIVDFPGKWNETFRRYSYIDVIKSYSLMFENEKGPVNLDDFKDAICLVGLTATAEPDVHPSPLESLYPGVGIHASLYNSIFYKAFIKRASKPANLSILILLGIITIIVTRRSKTVLSFLYVIGIVLIFFITATALFSFYGLWIDVFYPVIFLVLLYLGLTFRKYMTELHMVEVMEKELLIARNIQRSFLPKTKPKISGLEIDAKMLTARQVGGDLYDFVDISGKKAGVMIGDVSGKGVPAALYMAKVVSEFKSYADRERPSLVIHRLNDRLVDEAGSGLFVTISYLVFDTDKRIMNFSTGGHLPILMLRDGEEREKLLDTREGMPLGIMESEFSDGGTELKKGDLFVLYTDGVTEAMNSKGEMFGLERLINIVREKRRSLTGDIIDSILNEVMAYEGKLPQHDDITVIVIRVET